MVPLDCSRIVTEKIFPISHVVPPGREGSRESQRLARPAPASEREAHQPEHHEKSGETLQGKQLEAGVRVGVDHVRVPDVDIDVAAGVRRRAAART